LFHNGGNTDRSGQKKHVQEVEWMILILVNFEMWMSNSASCVCVCVSEVVSLSDAQFENSLTYCSRISLRLRKPFIITAWLSNIELKEILNLKKPCNSQFVWVFQCHFYLQRNFTISIELFVVNGSPSLSLSNFLWVEN
jgi:hypothetical protein